MESTIVIFMEVSETVMPIKATYTWYQNRVDIHSVTDSEGEELELTRDEEHRLISAINNKHMGVLV